MPHLASTVLLGTVVQLPALLLLVVQQEASLFEARPTVQCAPLVTCVHHPSRELFAVHLALTRLARQGKRIALIVLQGFVALIQSECYFPQILALISRLAIVWKKKAWLCLLSKGVTTETLGHSRLVHGLLYGTFLVRFLYATSNPCFDFCPFCVAVSSFKYPWSGALMERGGEMSVPLASGLSV